MVPWVDPRDFSVGGGWGLGHLGWLGGAGGGCGGRGCSLAYLSVCWWANQMPALGTAAAATPPASTSEVVGEGGEGGEPTRKSKRGKGR